MRNRLLLTLLAAYWIFVAGTSYYNGLVPLRVVHHLGVTALLVGWLVARLGRGDGLPATPLTRPLLAWVGVSLLAAAFALNPRTSLESAWLLFVHAVVFLILVQWVRRGMGNELIAVQLMMGLIVVIISGIELASWFFGLGYISGTEFGWYQVIRQAGVWPTSIYRTALAFNNSNLVAGYIAPLVVLAGGWGLAARAGNRRGLWGLAAIFLLLTLLTQSRGALLGVLAGAWALALLRLASAERITRRTWMGIGLGFVAASLAVILVVVAISQNAQRLAGNSVRLDLWRSAAAITVDHPLLGVGPGQFGRAYRIYMERGVGRVSMASAHNGALNLSAETGLIGAATATWGVFVFLRVFWAGRAQADLDSQRIRLEAACAALIVIAVHSLVDVFNRPPMLLMGGLLAAYIVGALPPPKPTAQPTPTLSRRIIPAALALIAVAYGVGLLLSDRAQFTYQRSLVTNRLDLARRAATQDPYLNLYHMNVAAMQGVAAWPFADEPDSDALAEAVASYEAALMREPTWAMGWLNLAALEETRGNLETALAHAQTASDWSWQSPAPVHVARYTEIARTADDDALLSAYQQAIRESLRPPTADFWGETAARRAAAALAITEELDPVVAYWVRRAIGEAAPPPGDPQSAADWYLVGQNATDPTTRYTAFDRAVSLDPTSGDYYLARGWAEYERNGDPLAIAADAQTAYVLGTQVETPQALLAAVNQQPDRRIGYLLAGVRAPVVPAYTAAVYFNGRPARLEPLPSVNYQVLPSVLLAPWYTLAAELEAAGNTDGAAEVYRRILQQDTTQEPAHRALRRLTAGTR